MFSIDMDTNRERKISDLNLWGKKGRGMNQIPGGESYWAGRKQRRRIIRRKRSDLPKWTDEDVKKAMEDPEYAEEMRQFIEDWDCAAGDGLGGL
jgi:hypothetical protein